MVFIIVSLTIWTNLMVLTNHANPQLDILVYSYFTLTTDFVIAECPITVVSECRRWLGRFLLLWTCFARCLGGNVIYGPLHDSVVCLTTITYIFINIQYLFIFNKLRRDLLVINYLFLHFDINFDRNRIFWFLIWNKWFIMLNNSTFTHVYGIFFRFRWFFFIIWILTKYAFWLRDFIEVQIANLAI